MLSEVGRIRKFTEKLQQKKYWIVALLLLIVLGKATYSYYQEKHKPVVNNRVQVEWGPIQSFVRAEGRAFPVNTVKVSSPIAGKIKEVKVKENERVTAGQVLMILDDEVVQGQAVDAKNQLDQATVRVEKIEELVKDGEASAAKLEQAKADLAAAKAHNDATAAQVAATVIRAPISGMVVGKPLTPGFEILPGLPDPTVLVSIADLSHMQVTAQIDQSDFEKIDVGQEVTFTADANPGEAFRGKVISVSDDAEIQRSQVDYPITIDVDSTAGRLAPLTPVHVSVLVGSKDRTLILPRAAFNESQGIQYVQMIVNGQPVNQAVKVGMVGDDMAEVLSGVKAGDIVLLPQVKSPTGGSWQ